MNKNTLLFLALAVAVLVGLFGLLHPSTETPVPQPAEPVHIAATAASAPVIAELPKPKRFELVVSKARLVSGPATIQVHEGDELELQITSDRADELHLHGYDLHLSLTANEPALLKLKAEHSGRFDYELHHAHLELGTLEVLPK
jgi:hypothetical protein